MEKKSSNVVPILKYAQANKDFIDRLSMFAHEQAITFTKSTEPLTGAVVVLYGRDSMKTIRFGLTPALTDFK